MVVVGGGNFFFFFGLFNLVVTNWGLWLSFGERWLCGFTREREKERGRKGKRDGREERET